MIQINLMQVHKFWSAIEKDMVAATITKNKWVRNIKMMHRNYSTRKQLAKLSEQELRDVGISKNDARMEVAKPFWK